MKDDTQDQLGRDVARALAARRPAPSHELEPRLRAAAMRSARPLWIVPAVLAGAVAVVAVVVIALQGDHTPAADERAQQVAPRTPTKVDAPVVAGGPAPTDTVDMLAPYQALLDRGDDQSLGLDVTQRARVRDFADELAKQRAAHNAQKEIAMIELRRELDRPDIDPARATAILDRVTAAEGAIRKAELTARIAARSVLTVKQRAAIGRAPTVATSGHAKLRIASAPAGARALVDGRVVGETPLVVTLTGGKHALQLDLPGYKSWTFESTLRDGETTDLEARLERKAAIAPPPTPPTADTGTLRLGSMPWAKVSIDGRDVGVTPLVIKLAPGVHEVLFDHEGSTHRRSVTIEAGKFQVVNVTLEKSSDPLDSRQ